MRIRVAMACLACLAAALFLAMRGDPAATAVSALARWLAGSPVEKAYVLTDRPLYAPGETLWYRAWLANGLTHTANSPSGVLYVELVDATGAAVLGHRARADSSAAWGELALPDTLPPGEYELRAHTRWMRNAGEGFFFRRPVTVAGPARPPSEEAPQFSFARSEDGDSLLAVLRFAPGQGRTEWTLREAGGDGLASGRLRPGPDGSARLSVWIPDSVALRAPSLAVGRDGEASFPLPDFRSSTRLELLPEGGRLVAGLAGRSAVSCADAWGKPVPIGGRILDDLGSLAAEFACGAAGVGTAEFTPQPGRSYRAETERGGYTHRSAKVATEAEGAALRVDGALPAEIAVDLRASPGAALPLTLLAHVRGQVGFAARSETGRREISARLPRSRFPAGLVHFTVFDALGRPLAERLVWNPTQEPVSVRLSVPETGRRRMASIQVEASDAHGPVAGDFAVSVASASAAPADLPPGPDIGSWMLAGSDLEGGLPPGWAGADLAAIDRILLTRGWRRFSWPELLGEGLQSPLYEVETGLVFSGRVVDKVTKKPAKDQEVTTVALGGATDNAATRTDADGRFAVELFLSDSSEVLIQTRNRRGRTHYDIRLDPPSGPAPPVPATPAPLKPDSAARAYADYWLAARERLLVDREHGLDPNYKLLGEVTVEAKREKDISEIWIKPTAGADVTIKREDVWFKKAVNAVEMLRGLHPHYMVSGDGMSVQARVRNTSGNRITSQMEIARVFLDGAETNWDIVRDIPEYWIDHIDLLYDPTQMLALSFLGEDQRPIVAYYTVRGDLKVYPPREGILNLRHPGYHAAREFFAPDYAVPDSSHARPDNRVTLWWQPRVRTGPDGRALVQFWTGDVAGEFRVRLEGLADDGRPVVAEGTLRVKEE